MSDSIRILSFDPSSTCIGYAEMTGCRDDDDPAGEAYAWGSGADVDVQLVNAGRLKPARGTKTAAERVESMCADLLDLVLEVMPQAIVLEMTSGKVNRKRHKGKGAGLAVYGFAVGAAWAVARHAAGAVLESLEAAGRPGDMPDVILVNENDWTEGERKAKRAGMVAALFPGYAKVAEQDEPGLDIADAIGLGRWWLTRRWQESREVD